MNGRTPLATQATGSPEQHQSACEHDGASLEPVNIGPACKSRSIEHCFMKSSLLLSLHECRDLLPKCVEDGERYVRSARETVADCG